MSSNVGVGQQFGHYQLVQHIGGGSFADVYLGEHITSGRQVAIKVLHAELAGVEVETFISQANALASLNHPHIVRVLEAGIEEQILYLVMEYAPHGTLRERHPHGTRLPIATVVMYVNQVAEALQYLHDQQIIHRDVKPHNMLLGSNYEILLSDFNIAAAALSMGYRRQKVQEFEGTILYAAPEQIRGHPRIASDQYALGVVVYEWLTGSWPFHGTVEEIASQHTLLSPPPLSEKVPGISPAIEQVVLKALAKNPYERFESVLAFAKALERASRLERQTTPHPLAPISPLPLTPSPNIEISSPSRQALLTYQGHSDKVHALAWSPDGKFIASSSLDETVHVWDANTGERILAYRNNSLQAQALAWSPDGKYIASTGGFLSEIVQVWDAATGHISPAHATYSGHTDRVQALAWSPDGTCIASASDDTTVQVWNATTGRTIFTYRGHSLSVKALAGSPQAPALTGLTSHTWRIASGSDDGTAQAWDARTGANIAICYAHRDKVNAVSWSPGGTHIASASDDMTVQVWDAAAGRKVLTYAGHSGGVTSVAWSPDGIYIASGGLDETVHVWNAITGTTTFTYRGHSDWISALAWSPDGKRLASGSWDKTIQVWAVGI